MYIHSMFIYVESGMVYLHLIGALLICEGLVRGHCGTPHGSTAASGCNTPVPVVLCISIYLLMYSLVSISVYFLLSFDVNVC